MNSKTFKPLEAIRKHRLDKAELEVIKARGRLKEAENELVSAHNYTESCNQVLLQAYARAATLGEIELIEIIRARYAIDDARAAIQEAKDQVITCEDLRKKADEDLQQARSYSIRCQRSLDAMNIIIGKMREEEHEIEFAKEEEAVDDITMSRAKRRS
jgi:hypothetical protein